MRIIDVKQIEEAVYRMALKAGVGVTESCAQALRRAAEEETSNSAKFALETTLKNLRIAQENRMPVCQDTGMAIVILEIGCDVYLSGGVVGSAVNQAVRRAYRDGYFRKSVCDPITRKNTGDNTPAVVHTEIVEGDKVKIYYLPKGFGSENMSRLYMLKPAQGVEGIIDSVVETVRLAGSRPCPPVYVGVGVGGTFDSCAYLSKRALLRDVGQLSLDPAVAEIERTCLEKINALGIGAQGFGGKVTALGVSVLTAPTHIAGLPVAVNVQCHCVRCEKVEL